jgi:serine protease inhibitor
MKPTKHKAMGRSLAEAALHFSQRMHDRYPQAVITPLEVPYTDEDLTIYVPLPERDALPDVRDNLIRLCLESEDELGVSMLTQVRQLPRKE